MEAPSSPREPSPPAIVVSTPPLFPNARKRKHASMVSGAAPSPAPSDPGATPAPTAENQVISTRHLDLASRPRLSISRHPGLVPIAPGAQYCNTDPLCMNRLNYRYAPAGLSPEDPPVFRTIESAPTCFRVSWEDRSSFVKVTPDGLGLKGEKGFRSARCNTPVREGKWYMEVKIGRGGGENPPDSTKHEGSHVRLGWARREAPLNGPAGLDGYSYALRDKTGEKVHLSRPRPYGRPIQSGDVIGMYISLPPRRQPDKKDPHDPAHFRRIRIPIEYKGQEYFESLEYQQNKEMMELMRAHEKEKAGHSASMPSSATKKSATVKNLPTTSRGPKAGQPVPTSLRPLPTLGPDSCIAFFVNGQCQGIAFQDIFDYLPLRTPLNKSQERSRRHREGIREHKENPFDDGTLGYYPFISLFNEATVRINPGPDFECPPPPDIDALLSPNTTEEDFKPLDAEKARTWRPMCERYPEYMSELWELDRLEEQDTKKPQAAPEEKKRDKSEKTQRADKPEKPERPEKHSKSSKQVKGTPEPQSQPQDKLKVRDRDKELTPAELEKLERHRAKRRAQAAARRERKKAEQAREEEAVAKRQQQERQERIARGEEVEMDVQPASDRFASDAEIRAVLAMSSYSKEYDAASPAPTAGSSVDVPIPDIVVRGGSSDYNSEAESADADVDMDNIRAPYAQVDEEIAELMWF